MQECRDAVKMIQRRIRPKMFTPSRVVALVLVLAAICALWTTEWMDRLQVFGNSLSRSPSSFVTNSEGVRVNIDVPLVPGQTDVTYDVFQVDESTGLREDPVSNEQPQASSADDEVEENDDQPPVVTEQQDLPRAKICVVSSNPRTASLFHSGTLRRIGNGKFDYQVTTKKCEDSSTKAPVIIRMYYQKTIAALNSKQLDTLFNNPENFIVIMGDEFCRCPAEICSYRAHARQYYSQSYVDYVTQHPSSDGNPTVYLPLGPRVEFPPVSDNEIIPGPERSLWFNLIVSPTSPSRKRLAAMVNANKGVFGEVFVHVTPAFAGNASEAKGFVAPEEYRRVLLNSKFTLCPAGHNPEAFRIFEACEAGSIPVLVKDEEYLEHDCKDSFAPLLASGAPFVVLDSWEELEEAMEPFKQDPSLLEKRQQELRHWYRKFWTDTASTFECSLAQSIDKINKLKQNPSPSTYAMPECGDDDDTDNDDARDSSGGESSIQTGDEDQVDASEDKLPVKSTSKINPTPLIVGCGRTGTLSLSQYLVDAVKAKSVHEKIEPNSISVSWLYAVPDAPAYPFEGRRAPGYRKWKAKKLKSMDLPLFSPVVHLVRHPLKVISSTRRCFCGRGTRSTGLGRASELKSWQFVEQFVKMPKPNLPYDSLLRSMTYWYEWNTLVSKRHKVTNRFRIEDLDPNELVASLGLTVPPGVVLPNRVPRAPSHVSPEHEKEALPDATWKDMYKEDPELTRKIFSLAKEYGYEGNTKSLEDLL